MIRSLKAARLTLARVSLQQPIIQQRTLISPTAPLRSDLVQDLYLRELKSYKPPPTKPSDSEGHVQKFSPPRAPKSPDEGDIASELKAYESQQVEVEGQTAAGEAKLSEDDWFEEEEEEEAGAAH